MSRRSDEDIRLMIEILHDLIYQSLRNSGSVGHIGSCRLSIINNR